ncbi:DNA cytosine methyltransferase [Campylobacter upsaliensis]|uniref:DNA cytosine methyltransferase n=1 Tax=Campylobacter upsaliensis TaxID=28080 RepID=UPI00214A70AD|nr:DNA cytosine methyltransferase [Campylobacter upsaliensis]MCR2098938.1 DNA cytosine methyltransferase [Campylobacter upsaliensis]
MLANDVLTYISLFSSAGVGCYGFKEAGFECIATNELLEKRLKIQKLNHKCKYENGYILGDIKKQEIKNQIFNQIDLYKRLGNDKIDVLIATPPCQGMSVANHKKSHNEIERNSLVVESVELIGQIKPRFFILENVASFYKTGCVDKNGNIVAIGDMIERNLHKEYSIYNEVLNFKNYGANSSRTRTLVIGVCKELKNYITPLELFPKYSKEKTLKQVIFHHNSLEWGEYDRNDFYHSFRIYPQNMREWIKDIKEGQSAFDNKEPSKRPHKIENGKMIENVNKNGDKYTRQKWDSVAPCIHTRNDQMASQNTIHPKDDRVFSIRELMDMMNIPYSFKWLPFELDYLNSLSNDEKRKVSKRSEMNIRQSIGEAVPTTIFSQIANNIKNFMKLNNLSDKEIKSLITNHNLQDFNNLKNFIEKNRDFFSQATLANIAEISNMQRTQNSAYFTNKFILNEIAKTLPIFDKDSIDIIEPSAGCGNFLPIIFKKYENVKRVNLKIIDIDSKSLQILKIIYKNQAPKNFNLEFICDDFLHFNCNNADLIVGNPPFSKTKGKNLAFLFLEKSLEIANKVSMIMPKNLLNTKEYEALRLQLEKKGVKTILDFGELGFNGVLIETINITTDKSKEIQVKSLPMGLSTLQKHSYIFDRKMPYWVIYRNEFFDSIFKTLDCGIFESFRDRQLTNSNTSTIKNDIQVIKSRNINDSGKIISIQGYDSYISKDNLSLFKVFEFLDRDDVYLTPNMTYNPRLIQKQKGYIVNGSVAILIPKKTITLTKKQLDYIASDEFRKFYKIARNYQTRTLNIDSTSCFWFGIKRSKNEK